MQQLFAAFQSPDNKENKDVTDSALEAFSRDLLLYKVEMGKFEQSFNMLDQEGIEYSSLEANIESKIQETAQSIVELTQELAQQKKLKQHREECEALSRIVNLVPSTRTILASSNLINDEISRLEEQLVSTGSIEKLRNRQVNLLVQSIADLSQSLEEEDALQKQLLELQQSLDNQTQDDDEANDENDDDMDAEDESRGDKRSERDD
jgi:THO complex subunit 7